MLAADKITESVQDMTVELISSSECSSMGEFDKQTLGDLQRSDGESFFQNVGHSPRVLGRPPKIAPSLQNLGLERINSRSRNISTRLTLKSAPWSNQSTALQSKAASKQEVGSGPLVVAHRAGHTDASSKTGLARHRNSIGLLTDNNKADIRSLSHLTNKDTPCQTSSGNKESYLLSSLAAAPGQKPSELSSRRGSKLAFFSLKSVKDISDPAADTNQENTKHFPVSSSLEILIEPVADCSQTQTVSNHQVPLVSRIPSRLMKRQPTSRSLFVAKRPNTLQVLNQAIAHLPGDVCGDNSLIPESCLNQQAGLKPDSQPKEIPNFEFRLLPMKSISSTGETTLLNNSRKFLDESSVRLQSIRGSTHSLQKRKNQHLLAPAPSLRRLSSDRWRAAQGNAFLSIRLPLDESGIQEQSSRFIDKSNMSYGNPPAFEISRMQLLNPSSIRSPSLKNGSSGTPNPKAYILPKSGAMSKKLDAQNSTGPVLDTIPDLEAMINECEVLQRQLITKTTRNQKTLTSSRH